MEIVKRRMKYKFAKQNRISEIYLCLVQVQIYMNKRIRIQELDWGWEKFSVVIGNVEMK